MRYCMLLLFIFSCQEMFSQAADSSVGFHPVTIDLKEQGCTVKDKEKEAINKMANYEYDYYSSIFQHDSIHLNIVIVGDRQEYMNYRTGMSPWIKEHSLGFFSAQQKKAVIYKSETFINTTYHEISHAILTEMLGTRMKTIPTWLNEGLARYFGTAAVKRKRIEMEENSLAIKWVKHWFGLKLINLEKYFNWSREEWNINNIPAGYPYVLAYSLVNFFMAKDAALISKLLTEFSSGKSPADALNAAYPGGIAAIDKDFQNYLNRQ